MGIWRRLFGDLDEGIWDSGGVNRSVFGDLGEGTWASGRLRASLSADWSVCRWLEAWRQPAIPKKSHIGDPELRLGYVSSPKTLTVTLGRVPRISTIRRFSVH